MSEFTVDRRHESELVVKRSRFIAILAPCPSLQTLQDFLKLLAIEHPHATHITYAFRIKTLEGLRERCHDAGEPSGTAGRPILQHLQSKQLVNVCLSVVRHFGGIKLGAGGLTRAYRQAAHQVLENAQLKPHFAYQTLEMEIDYARFHLLDQRLASIGASIEAVEYGPQVKATLRVPMSQVETVKQLLQS